MDCNVPQNHKLQGVDNNNGHTKVCNTNLFRTQLLRHNNKNGNSQEYIQHKLQLVKFHKYKHTLCCILGCLQVFFQLQKVSHRQLAKDHLETTT